MVFCWCLSVCRFVCFCVLAFCIIYIVSRNVRWLQSLSKDSLCTEIHFSRIHQRHEKCTTFYSINFDDAMKATLKLQRKNHGLWIVKVALALSIEYRIQRVKWNLNADIIVCCCHSIALTLALTCSCYTSSIFHVLLLCI